jgi:hypothetical protein
MSEASKELEMVSLKQICEELGITPASARRKLRNKLEKSAGDFRWEFTDEQAEEVRAILTKVEVAEEAVAA